MKKTGFTLIELLAVIVILAIIALIATPIVLNIIKDTKESSGLRSAEFYLGAVETAVTKKIMDDSTFKPTNCKIQSDSNLNCDGINVTVEIKGEAPIGGEVILQNGKVKDVIFDYNEKTIVKKYDTLQYIYRESRNIEIPVLYNDILTPVVYDGNNWIIADITEKWYNYSSQEWANAVILNSSVKKEIGDIITVEGENPDALAMFVWIPRYEYKIEGKYGKGGTNASSPGEIEVNFITKDTKESTDTYRIHPAFNFGGEDISGIWVGKFELSHTIKNSYLNCKTETCVESDNLRILPNTKSLSSSAVSSFFYAIRSMSKDENIFGIKSSIMDTHMIKNSEWGAVAYLSQSRYGKYGNNTYVGKNKEVYINNSSSMYTGRSGGSYGGNTQVNKVYSELSSTNDMFIGSGYYTYDGYLLEYNTNNKTETRDMNKVASTTGNIYGIYDMSGGGWEFVMGVFANSEGDKWTHNSGFSGKTGESGIDKQGLDWPDEKYYDLYKASSGITISPITACNGDVCYGHALSETSGWYVDLWSFVFSTEPWFRRGGSYGNGINAGVFFSYGSIGSTEGGYASRAVITQAT